MLIVLIGYRGTGKSSVARALAEMLECEAIDADVEIERRAGKPIRDVFADDGETKFRQFEREVMADLLARDRVIVAAGGGAIQDEHTRRDLCDKADGRLVVWLKAAVDTIERRLAEDSSTAQRRPNLTAGGGRGEIEQLLAVREPLYRECASLMIETDTATVDEIAEQICNALGQPRRGSD
jgi:shikimate kinase